MKTFYYAGSSSQVKLAQSRAARMEEWGMRWHDGSNWARSVEQFGAKGHDLTASQRDRLTRADLSAATKADLFVASLGTHSAGTLMEIGARLAARDTYGFGPCCVILDGAEDMRDHMFFSHSAVRLFEDWPEFSDWLAEWLEDATGRCGD